MTCNLAWITYVNQGSVEDASGRQAITWLESAVLEYANFAMAHPLRSFHTGVESNVVVVLLWPLGR